MISLAFAANGSSSDSGGSGGFILTIIILGILIYFLWGKKWIMDYKMASVSNFDATQKIVGIDYDTSIAIDENRKKVCLMNCRNNQSRIFSYRDLLSSEIFEDGETVTKTMRGSQIGGALVGTVLLGGVGTIIGGLSGKRKTTGTVNKMVLRVTVNDAKNPVYEIKFLNKETRKDTQMYQQAIQQARHWHGLIEVLIKRADMEDNKQTNVNVAVTTPLIQQSSVADEVKKLADLRTSGVLTEQEFEQQKRKLLGN